MGTQYSILLTIDGQNWYFCNKDDVRACDSSSWERVMDEIAEYAGEGSVYIGIPSMDCFPFQRSQTGKIRSSQIAYDAEPFLPMRAEEMVIWSAYGRQTTLSVIVNQSTLAGVHEAASRNAVHIAGFFPSVVPLVNETTRKGVSSVCIEMRGTKDVLEFTDGELASWQHEKLADRSTATESRVTVHDECNRCPPKTVSYEDLLRNLDAQAVKQYWGVGDGHATRAADWLQSTRVLSEVMIVAMALIMVTLGLHRRAMHWNAVAATARGEQVDMFRELLPDQTSLPFSIPDRLRSESQGGLVTGAASVGRLSAASSFFQLLSSMPEANGWEVSTIHSTGGQVTVTGVADDAQVVPVLSKAISQSIDSDYSVNIIPKVVRIEDGGVEFTLTVGYEAP